MGKQTNKKKETAFQRLCRLQDAAIDREYERIEFLTRLRFDAETEPYQTRGLVPRQTI